MVFENYNFLRHIRKDTFFPPMGRKTVDGMSWSLYPKGFSKSYKDELQRAKL